MCCYVVALRNSSYNMLWHCSNMFSVHSQKGFRDFVKNRGVDFVIEKPPNTNEIEDLIRKILSDSKF